MIRSMIGRKGPIIIDLIGPGGIRTKELCMEEISIQFALSEVNTRELEQLTNLRKSY